MTAWRFSLPLLFTLIAPATLLAQNPKPNLNEASTSIAETIAGFLKAKVPAAGKDRIAVMVFGDKNNTHPQRMGTLGVNLRGQLIEALKDALTKAVDDTGASLAAKFSVLSADQLEAVFQTTANDPQGLSDSNLDLARKILAAQNLQIGIVGHFEFDGNTIATDTIGDKASLSITAIFKNDAKTVSLDIKASEILLHILNGTNNKPGDLKMPLTSRFKIEVAAKPKNSSTFETIPLQTVSDPKNPLFKSLVLVIDENKFKGQEYKIVVSNNGQTPISFLDGSSGPGKQDQTVIVNDVNEKDRVFLLSSYVDGVSTILRRSKADPITGQFTFDKDTRNYPLVTQYVFSGIGRLFVEDPNSSDKRFKEAKLIDTVGPGHSLLEIKGFLKIQPDGQQSKSGVFIFGDAKQSVGAELIGTGISQIGIMSFHFFAEQLTDDKLEKKVLTIPANAGTLMGGDLITPTITVGVRDIYRIPVETFHIVYMYQDPNNPIPTTPITQQP